jgi:uncharacterized protein
VNAAFADTSFFLALLRAGDPANARARAELAASRQLVTTEFIVLELGNACARAEDHGDFLALVAGMRSSTRTTIIGLDSSLLERGMQMMAARKDKDCSLTDCISFIVMQERGLHDALTTDKHFEQAGFQALLK